jgi:hypothetical protein
VHKPAATVASSPARLSQKQCVHTNAAVSEFRRCFHVGDTVATNITVLADQTLLLWDDEKFDAFM